MCRHGTNKHIDDHQDDFPTLLKNLLEHRKKRQVKEADTIKNVLWNKYSIQVFYRRDGTIGWNKVPSLGNEETKVASAVKQIVWSEISDGERNKADGVELLSHLLLPTLDSPFRNIPLIIATVKSPQYRSRLSETMHSLSHHASFNEGTQFAPITSVDMLNLSENPSIGTHRILFEGWRKILLPRLLSSEYDGQSIIFVAEDDLRLCKSISPGKIRELCLLILDANPDLHILSLGHAYSARQKPGFNSRDNSSRNPPCDGEDATTPQNICLKGLHGTTLLALRHPEGSQSLLRAMENIPYGKRCHLDRFLFHSTLQNLEIAITYPPLVGWAEVSETLTSVGAGCRRKGRGRLGQLPDVTSGEIKWIRRKVS